MRWKLTRTRPDLTQVVERLGKFDRVLEPGIHLLIPVVSQLRQHPDPAANELVRGGQLLTLPAPPSNPFRWTASPTSGI